MIGQTVQEYFEEENIDLELLEDLAREMRDSSSSDFWAQAAVLTAKYWTSYIGHLSTDQVMRLSGIRNRILEHGPFDENS